MSDVIKIDSLTVHYENFPALIDINVEIERGKLTAVIGPNGAGKSTFIKAILHLIERTSGRVSFFGHSFEQMRTKIAYISQNKEIDWSFPITVREVVLMGAYNRLKFFRSYSKEDEEKCDTLLKKFDLYDKRNSLIGDLSGGQRQRIFIARAYMQDVEIFIFDEPMAFVDYITSELIIESMQELKKIKKTVICVHHNLEEVKKTFDQAILLAHHLVDYGDVDKVLEKKNLKKAYGAKDSLLTDAFILSREKESGLL